MDINCVLCEAERELQYIIPKNITAEVVSC